MKKLLTAMLTSLIAFTAVTPVFASSNRSDLYRFNRLRDEACEKNMHALYTLLQQYATANNGLLPTPNNFDGLKMLFPNGITIPQLLCSAARGKTPKKERDLNNKTISYIYFGGVNLKLAIKDCPKLILLCDKPDSRHCFALLADGSVVDVKSLPGKPKISNCQELVALLNSVYKYPPALLKLLQSKAKATDKNVSGKKR